MRERELLCGVKAAPVVRFFLACVLLTLLSCQPYMDHEVRLFDFDQDFADFGPKRQLELVEVQGDNESLTFDL